MHWKASVRTAALAILVVMAGSPSAAAQTPVDGIWISRATLLALPTTGAAWARLQSEAAKSCLAPDLADQDDPTNVCVMAKALVAARTGDVVLRDQVMAVLTVIVNSGPYSGRALALGRELAAYVIAADLIELRTQNYTLDQQFRTRIKALLTTPTIDGPASLIKCHEQRPNNWGAHCGGSRAAVAAYLGDDAELARAAAVFKGYLGDRTSYTGFSFGDLSWQCDPARPVAVNPVGCLKLGNSIDGVVPDDQRRAGGFVWPPPKENYVYEGLQGALAQAIILNRAGYDTFGWESHALLRAFQWLHTQADFPAEGDDIWEAHVINHFYGTSFPAALPASPGKNVGWTDWTHAGVNDPAPISPPEAPTGLSAAAPTSAAVQLTWTDASATETAVHVERSVSGGPFLETTTLGENVTSYTDAAVTEGTAYSYRVRAVNAAGFSPYSSVADVTTPVAPPLPPTGLSALAPTSSAVQLAWTDRSMTEMAFHLERATGVGAWVEIAAVAADTLGYSDTTVTGGTAYGYRVRARGAGGFSSYSNAANVTTPPAPAPVSATFLGVDTTTRGNWRGVYGSQGYEIVKDAVSYPAYASVVVKGASTKIWKGSTTDVRALQQASGKGRLAACWYSNSALTLDITLTDSVPHRVSVYLLDWDTRTRRQRIDVLDAATGALLDTRTVASFQGGQYLTWTLRGHVILRVTNTGSPTAVVSGLFFDAS